MSSHLFPPSRDVRLGDIDCPPMRGSLKQVPSVVEGGILYDLRFTTFTPPLLFLTLHFLLDFRYSKKTLLLIASEGKKWGSCYLQTQIGGKKCRFVLVYVGGKM